MRAFLFICELALLELELPIEALSFAMDFNSHYIIIIISIFKAVYRFLATAGAAVKMQALFNANLTSCRLCHIRLMFLIHSVVSISHVPSSSSLLPPQAVMHDERRDVCVCVVERTQRNIGTYPFGITIGGLR